MKDEQRAMDKTMAEMTRKNKLLKLAIGRLTEQAQPDQQIKNEEATVFLTQSKQGDKVKPVQSRYSEPVTVNVKFESFLDRSFGLGLAVEDLKD